MSTIRCVVPGRIGHFGPQRGDSGNGEHRTRRWKTGAGIFVRLRDVVINAPGAGAAGGMGAALLGLTQCGITRRRRDCRGNCSEQAVKDADLVIAGEGRLDVKYFAARRRWRRQNWRSGIINRLSRSPVGAARSSRYCINRVSMQRCRFFVSHISLR